MHFTDMVLRSQSRFRSRYKWECGPEGTPGAQHSAWVVTAWVSQQGFSRQSSLLFKILSSVRNHQINSDLAQLLLRLDYNKYYTQAGGTLGR